MDENSSIFPLIKKLVCEEKMVDITLPDGSIKNFDKSVTGLEVAESIGSRLAKASWAVKVNGELKDLSTLIDSNASLEIITNKSPEALDILRHDAAHVLAEAVKELYPETQVTIGPVIENGFYYDFARTEPFSENDLEKIEKRMKVIVDRNETITREEWDRDEAVKFFNSIGEKYKAEIISDIPSDQPIGLYRQGDFIDLCRGPHLPSTSKLGKAFKLLKVSGAYWRADSNNEMLQRIYGTAWLNDKDLKNYLTMLEEAKKRDHRVLGKQMNLFHFQDDAPGAIFWHHKGWSLYRKLLDYMRNRQAEDGYQEINTPEVMDKSIWETSGHWQKFSENMFTTETGSDSRTFCLKPMSCPGACIVYKQGVKSYRDLPLRVAEFGKVFRNEPSGTLHGLLRVRAFTQDDAHIFCTEEQVTEECKHLCDQILKIYSDFDFDDVKVKFSDRPEVRVGSDEVWDISEKALMKAVEAAGLEYTINKGEGAFYGPKLEFVLRDAIGRDWQAGTIQLDLNLPGRFKTNYVDSDGQRKVPVMIHRALFGSVERFIGILIENFAGNFPFWLAPTQVAVLTINETCNEYAQSVLDRLKKLKIESILDIRNEKISYKVREHTMQKIPLILVIGNKEMDDKAVSMRWHGKKESNTKPLEECLTLLEEMGKGPAS
jgi:threonyl-tRNA synthetase